MRLFRRIKKRSTDAHFLALDIGTDVVKAFVCEAEGSKGRILGVGRKKQGAGDMNCGLVTDISAVIRNCHSAIREAENMSGISTNKMILGISGEFVKGATTRASHTRRDPSNKIDLAELKNIVHKLQWKGFEVVRAQLARDAGYSELDVKLVNAAIVDVRIDDYKVSNPIGFQGKEVSLGIFNAFAPLVHYGALQTIAAEIDRELIAIAAEPYAITRCVDAEDAIFIDVGAGITDIAVVKSGALIGTKMFTLGGRTFTKRLSQSLNISLKEAEEIKLTYSSDNLERQSHRIVREAMKADADIWLSGVVLALEEFDHVTELPPKILLSGGGAHLPEIKEALESRDWVKSLNFPKKPQINFMHPKMVTNLVDETRLLKDQQDIVPMALANLSLSYMAEEQLLSKVLKKVVRLMQI